jgi:hypothetical protein
MQQALLTTKSFYQASHKAIINQLQQDHPVGAEYAILGLDFFSTWLPFGSTWLHEEWHRTVLQNRGYDSYNDVYSIPLFSSAISVNEVRDEDLIELKQNHPQELVRLHAAGIEAQTELSLILQQEQFFYDSDTHNGFLIWFDSIDSFFYLQTCASVASNDFTNEFLKQENTNIADRDFTGLDCNAWVYDLFRPHEPYASRGTHPSGTGIDRYISLADLTPNEKSYLQEQRTMFLLNFIDPFKFGKDYFTYRHANGEISYWNARLAHHLTSFGYSVDTHILIKQSNLKLHATLHAYHNYKNWFPGVSLQLLRQAFDARLLRGFVSLRTAVWLQPKNQVFATGKTEPGGLLALKSYLTVPGNWEPYVELEYKTDGWVAGNVHLEQNARIAAGVSYLWK